MRSGDATYCSGHGEQAPAPSWLTKLASHVEHDVWLRPANVPARHAVHASAPPSEKVPAWHASCDAGDEQKAPGAHDSSNADPCAQKLPSAHGWQSECDAAPACRPTVPALHEEHDVRSESENEPAWHCVHAETPPVDMKPPAHNSQEVAPERMSVDEPAAHRMQPVLHCPSAYVPIEQALHSRAPVPRTPVAWPSEQFEHCALATRVEYVPATHATHDVGVSVNEPAPQELHAVFSLPVENVPPTHGEQVLAPTTTPPVLPPAPQLTHAAFVAPLAYRPIVHCTQAVAPAAALSVADPGPHGAQTAFSPPTEAVPGGQASQRSDAFRNWPALQTAQPVFAAPTEYVPSAHEEHELAPAPSTPVMKPATQSSHAALLERAENVPGAQRSHELALDVKDPGPQDVHTAFAAAAE